MGHKPGDPVQFEFNGTASGASVAITIKDQNSNTRALQPYERLIIDSVVADVAASNTADLLSVGAGATSTAAGTLLASFSPNVGEYHGGPLDVPTGVTPSVLVSSTGAVKLSGAGRIINGTTQGVRPNWQCKLQ